MPSDDAATEAKEDSKPEAAGDDAAKATNEDATAAAAAPAEAEKPSEAKPEGEDVKPAEAAAAGGKKKVLIVSTSAATMGDHPTGAWSEEICGPFYVFEDASCDVTVCTIAGGDVPIDQGSLSDQFKTDNDKKMIDTGCAPLKGTKALKDVDTSQFDILWFAGGHGTCVDFPTDEVGAEVAKALDTGKVVGAVCHGIMAFVKAMDSKGEPIVKGKKLTCFTDEEEGMVGLEGKVPFLLESRMKELGADMQAADAWSDKAVSDGKLITGQNPQSSVSAAKLALAAC